MMDDMLRTKHHINPQAQCDYPRTQQQFLLKSKHRAKDGRYVKRRTQQLESERAGLAGLALGYGEER